MNKRLIRYMKRLLLFALVLAGLAGCVKPPTYPDVPVITWKSASTNIVRSGYVDTLIFSFTDGDGDIGVTPSSSDTCDLCAFKKGDSSCLHMGGFNIFLIDSRDTCVSTFASANIEQKGRFDDISGELVVITAIDSKKCLAPPNINCPNDTVRYKIVLRDKAGHFSNFIETDPIIVLGHW